MAVRLDRSRRHLAGEPAPVLNPVPVLAGLNGNSGIFVSRGGALVTSRGGTRSQLTWLSRNGSTTPVAREVHSFATPRLSPDGRRIAVVYEDQDKANIWIYDIDTGTFSRLASPDAAASPSWTPDGKRVVYVGLAQREGSSIWSQAADGGSPPEKLFDARAIARGVTVSPDGRSILYVAISNNSWDIFRVPLDSPRVARPYLNSPYSEYDPRFSPDGRWVTIVSDESGRFEVYARSFPDPAARVQISAGGGFAPLWSADGKSIFYRSGSSIIAARMATSPSLRVLSRDTVVPRSPLWGTDAGDIVGATDISRDGRFLGLVSNKDDFQLVVVPNWLPELEQRLAGRTKR